MAEIIYGNESRLLPWAQERIGVKFRRDAYTIGLERNGSIVAVVVYDGFSDCDVNMHVASDGTKQWLNKNFLITAFAYPFIQLKLNRVTGLVPENNQEALKFDKNLGFVREGYHPFANKDGSALISLGMLRRNCRFIPEESR